MILRLKNFLLDFLFPSYCLGCQKEGPLLCQLCKTTLPVLAPVCIECKQMSPAKPPLPAGHTCKRCKKNTPINVFLSPFSYRHPLVSRFIHEFKYRRIQPLSLIIADLLVSYLQYYHTPFPPHVLIVPIPLHPRKERVRGFNQAMLLASELSKKLSLPVDGQALIRITPTSPQTMLAARSRRENVHNVFSVRDTAKLRGKNIILVDDVKTTGATLKQAARILKKAGTKEIWAITVAH